MRITFLVAAVFSMFLVSCKKSGGDLLPVEPSIVFKFKFDPTQQRLNNLGLPSTMPAGHAGLDPIMNKMSAHYIELAATSYTQVGGGAIIYKAPETSIGGSGAINFDSSIFAGNGDVFFAIPLKNIPAGDYEYLRLSLAYQNFDINFHVDTTINAAPAPPVVISQDFPGTVSSFVGFNTYIRTYKIKNLVKTVNANKLQGYWGFESTGNISGVPFNYSSTGQAPAGATTVVNPINATSPVPAGSCLITGAFAGGNKLHITGKESADIVITVSLSTNKSFEWIDTNGNGKWDPTKGEQVVDMGLRGMIPSF